MDGMAIIAHFQTEGIYRATESTKGKGETRDEDPKGHERENISIEETGLVTSRRFNVKGQKIIRSYDF
jgi:hypothetical protein